VTRTRTARRASQVNSIMIDNAMPSLSIACLGACKRPAIRLSGQVLRETADLLGLRVEAWDRGRRIADLLACGFTDAHGVFELVFPAETLRVFFGDHGPTLFFRVFAGPTLLADTETLPGWDLDESTSSRVTIDLPRVSPDEPRITPAPFTVRGHLRNAAGTPLVGLVVRAFDRNLRDRETELLHHATTDAIGRYLIPYAVEELGRPGKHQADLVLRVYHATGELLGAIDSRCQAPAALVLDLLVEAEAFRGPSEFEALTARLLPLLPEGVGTADLTDEDIAFLTCSGALDAEQLAALVSATILGHDLDVPAALLYGLAREGLSLEIPALVTRTPEDRAAAFDTAFAERIIPASLGASRGDLLAHLEAALLRHHAKQPITPGKHSLDALLATVLASPADRDQLVALQLAHQGSGEAFWAKVEAHPTFGAAALALAFTATIATITDNHLALIKALQDARRDGTLRVARDLASLDEAGWKALLDTAGVPADAPGSGPADKAARYAADVQARVEEAFPSAFFVARFVEEQRSDEQELAGFLHDNPDFDLGTSRLDEYLASVSAGATDNNSDLTALQQSLAQMQRIFKLAPRYRDGRALLDAGLTSAQHVVRMGRSRFVDQFAERMGGPPRAEAIHARAAHVVAASLTLFGQHHASMNALSLRVLPTATTRSDVSSTAQGISALRVQAQGLPLDAPALFRASRAGLGPRSGVDLPFDLVSSPPAMSVTHATLTDLFGAFSFCACDQCQSVHGAAAYLVEILAFLEPHTNKLFARRPDLGRIELSCENTNTPLPYIDLVNEVLERRITGAQSPSPQTTRTAAELAVSPEHVDAAAYATLAADTTIYPWSLPFDLGLEQSRVFLTHLGVPRHELLAALGSVGTDPKAIAAEILGLSLSTWALVAGTNSSDPKTFWGPAPLGWWPTQNEAVPVPLPELLQRAHLTYAELTAVLATRFVKQSSTLDVVFDAGSCALEDGHVNLDLEALGRIHRFVRLQEQLGWTPGVLDQALAALSPPGAAPLLSEAILLQLASVQQLSVELAQPISSLVAFWGAIDTAPSDDGAPSRYAQLFQNPAVLQIAGSGGVFALNSGTGDIATPAALTSVLPSLLAALQIPSADLSLLTDSAVATSVLHVPSAVVATDALTLANLSCLYRHVALARALRLSVGDLLTLQILSGLDPFDRQHVDVTLRFVHLAAKVRASGFKIAELDYLLRDVQPSPGTIGPDPGTIAQLVDAIRAGLQALAFDSSADPSSDAAIAARLPLLKETLAPTLKLDSAVLGLLLTQIVASPADPAQSSFVALSALVNSAAPTESAAQTLVRLSKTALLLKRFKLTVGELGFLQGADDRPWIVKRAPALGWLDLNALPPKLDAAPTPSLLAWERMLDYVNLRSRFPQGTPLLALFHAPTSSLSEPVLLKAIADRTGVAMADLDALTSTWSLSLVAGDYQDERTLARVQAAIEIVHRLGVPAARAITWANVGADVGARLLAAGDIRKTAKAKYDNDTWSSIARPLQNALRAKQRSALVAYLIEKGDFRDENALFEHVLLDTQVTPCVMTSRIKQAIGSVQLFVQRALMHLEPAVPLAPEAAKLWTWMKTYRVWEAGRKIFLYPENWILPELRDDKTPFFKELEQDLKKHDVTSEIAEQAFRRYVEKLDEVARLEVVGMYREVEKDAGAQITTDVLHVIGRTYASPRVYFYRKQVKLAAGVAESPLWTPWEKIDLDIEGDHLLPIIHEGRLRLLWPLFNQKSFARPLPVSALVTVRAALQAAVDKLPPGLGVRKQYQNIISNITQQIDSAAKTVQIDYFEIKLAWSEYKSGRWSSRKVASKTISSQAIEIGVTHPPDASKYVFHVETQGDELVVRSLLPLFQPANDDIAGNSTKIMAGGEIRLSGCAGQDTSLDMAFVVDDIIAHTYSTLTNMTVADRNALWAETGFLPAQAPLQELLANRRQKVLLATNPADGYLFALIPHQFPQLDARRAPFFAHDARQSFIVSPVPILVASNMGFGSGLDYLFRFEGFAHPYSCDFVRALNRDGIDGLLLWGPKPNKDPADATHLLPDHVQWASAHPFAAYGPPGSIAQPYPVDEVDTASDGVYAAYNREIFFHAPFLVADRLSKNQRFEEAQNWFHYIFDPTDGSTLKAPARYWKYRPFYEEAGRMASGSLEELLSLLGGKTPAAKQARATLEHEVSAWRQDPFNPHRIARLRPAAYPKNVVMRYIQNLIDWGDQLFRRDTLETLNEATLLYVLASDILGPRPVVLPAHPGTKASYLQLQAKLNSPHNDRLVNLEGMIPAPIATSNADDSALNALLGLGLSGFCVPPNERLLGLWDSVADRLFKIRNCMNIEGVVRELPLFEPPIDPALLVRAAAAGLDLGTVLGQLNAPAPLYRFQALVGRAAELCGDVRALGGALLAALEKRDAEAVSLLRSSHELQLLDAVRDVKVQQIREAERAFAGLQKAREVVEIRYDFYRTAVFISPSEQQALILSAVASELQMMSQTIVAGSAAVYAIADISIGTDGPYPTMTAEVAGGKKAAAGMQAFGQAMGIYASLLGSNASMSATLGGYQRRADDWKREEQALAKELQQMDKQLLGAEIRLAIAERELENHDLQRDNAREADALLHDKFTNDELYDWMVGELSAVHFQSYRLAWDAARHAERAFQFELRDDKASFLQPGAWDSLRKGLLAGEKLQHDLRRMEMAYLDKNVREFEITKHISLAQLDPFKLVQLRETGACVITLPELLFDHDFPGHYFRRIKTVSLTVPCVPGQYNGLNARLTLVNSAIRREAITSKLLVDVGGAPETIVTSGGQNDSGLFDANLHDERYLPFEGKGVISTWTLEINPATNAFDLATISDVILQLRYTATDGGDQFKTDVTTALTASSPPTALVLVDPRAQFPDAWYRFLHPAADQTEAVLTLPLAKDQLPFLPGADPLVITQVEVLWKWNALAGGAGSLPLTITAPKASDPAISVTLPHTFGAPVGGLGHATAPDPIGTVTASPGTWRLNVAPNDLATWPEMLDGLWLLLTVTRGV
jgi:hypothetical protein